MIVLTWKLPGQPEQVKEYPDDRLQELMDRANAKFGAPRVLAGPITAPPKDIGSPDIPKPRRKK